MLESKSSSAEKGLQSELHVIEYFENYKLLAHRFKTPYAEVDLLFDLKSHLLLVEVKSYSSAAFLPNRITSKQKDRLFRAATYLQNKFKKPVEINWAFVSAAGDVLVITDVTA